MAPGQVPDAFERQMSASAAEWERLLRGALVHHDWRRLDAGGAEVTLTEGGTLTLRWHVIEPHRIALLKLPALRVAFEFQGVAPPERASFMRHLDLYTHRGGG